jgi:hypothetical protein
MKKLLILLILLVFAAPVYPATIYKWVDKDGVVNFTDDLSKVPPSYRNRVEKEERKDVKEKMTPQPPQAATREDEPEEVKRDNYGRDEIWWRERVRPWKEKLKEATEKYEETQTLFTKKAEDLSQNKFLYRSKSSTPWEVSELNRLGEEKKRYEAQIAEANEMLEKISKEARESDADPAWLE